MDLQDIIEVLERRLSSLKGYARTKEDQEDLQELKRLVPIAKRWLECCKGKQDE